MKLLGTNSVKSRKWLKFLYFHFIDVHFKENDIRGLLTQLYENWSNETAWRTLGSSKIRHNLPNKILQISLGDHFHGMNIKYLEFKYCYIGINIKFYEYHFL